MMTLQARNQVQMATLYDIPGFETRLISPDEIKERHPLIDISKVCGNVVEFVIAFFISIFSSIKGGVWRMDPMRW
jgi:hypothetical protein